MDTFLYSALGLGSFLTIFNLNQAISILNEKLNKLENAQTFLPESLISFLKQNLENQGILNKNGFQKNESNPDEITGKVFLKGIASTRHPIKSRLMPQLPLIYSNYYINKVYSNNIHNDHRLYQINQDDLLRQSLYQGYPNSPNESIINEAPYFNLYGYEAYDDKILKTIKYRKKPDIFCQISRNMKIDAKGAARLIGSRIYYKSLSLVERLIVFIYLILEAIFSRQATVKGIRVGYVEHEVGIRNDSLLDVYGKVIYDTKKKNLRMEFPEFFLRNKKLILNRIFREIRDKKMFILFLMIPLILSMVKLGSKALAWIKKWNNLRQNMNKDKLNSIKKIVIDDLQCMVCLLNINNVILVPCEHFCMCKECYLHKIEQKKCPKCNREINEIIEVFLP